MAWKRFTMLDSPTVKQISMICLVSKCSVSATEQQEVVERFLAAVRQGDLQGLLDVLAPQQTRSARRGGTAHP